MEVLNHYKKELLAIAMAFGLISYTVYVFAAEPVKAPPVVVKSAKPVKKEAAKPVEVKKEHKKKPTLKKKYADKK
jgi:hypothetical protein